MRGRFPSGSGLGCQLLYGLFVQFQREIMQFDADGRDVVSPIPVGHGSGRYGQDAAHIIGRVGDRITAWANAVAGSILKHAAPVASFRQIRPEEWLAGIQADLHHWVVQGVGTAQIPGYPSTRAGTSCTRKACRVSRRVHNTKREIVEPVGPGHNFQAFLNRWVAQGHMKKCRHGPASPKCIRRIHREDPSLPSVDKIMLK